MTRRLVAERILVKTTGGTDSHRNCSCSTRPDGTLVVYDADGVNRKLYSRGYWLMVTLEEER